jgi:hypothetical protein
MNIIPALASMKLCVDHYGIPCAELERWIWSGWVRTKKNEDNQQGRLTLRTDDIQSAISNLGKGREPTRFRHSCAILSWDEITKTLSVRFQDAPFFKAEISASHPGQRAEDNEMDSVAR